jgi:hypothetical protein
MGERARKAVEPLSVELYARKVAAIYRSVARYGNTELAGEACTRS